jgi:hypothetical protein
MKCCKRIKGFRHAVRLTEQGLIRLDEAIKQDWAEMKKNHPVQAAISLARVKKINQLAELRNKRPRNTGAERTVAETDVFAAMADVCREIKMWTTWLPEGQTSIPPRLPTRTGSETLEDLLVERALGPTEEKVREFAKLMLNSGFPEITIRGMLEAKSHRKRGRPAKRPLTVKALELLLAEPDLSWKELASELRNLQPSGPNPSTGGSVRKMVGNLIRVLIERQVELPPPWNKVNLISFREEYFPEFVPRKIYPAIYPKLTG